MKSAIILLITVAAVLTQEYYDSSYDIVDTVAELSNEEMVRERLACFLDKVPCDERSERVKGVLPEMIKTACAKCSPLQKSIMNIFLEYIEKLNPIDKAPILTRFDPENKYLEPLTAAVQDA